MAIYAAGNIAIAVDNFKARGYARLRGVILNCRNVEDEEKRVAEFADSIDSKIVAVIPRDASVQQAEALGKTVVAAFPDSEMAEIYRKMAREILKECKE